MKPIALIGVVLTLAGMACALPSRTATGDEHALPTDQPPDASPVASLIPTSAPTPTEIPGPTRRLWMCYWCSGDQIWVLGDAEPHQRTLPVPVGRFYGYSPATDRILFAPSLGDHGAGPGNVSVSDLAILDVASGTVTPLFSDNIVEALWAPNGQDFAYILATPSTYELHWWTAAGEDRLLSDDVTFTWSVSPLGDAVAFTRESGYELSLEPGLFVASVATGTEVRLSDVDKSGRGGIEDQPIWSPDGSFVLLNTWGSPGDPQLVFARSDGSRTVHLMIDPALSSNWWYTDVIPGLLWHPDGEHLLTVPGVSAGEMGGPSPVVLFRIDFERDLLMDAVLLGEAMALIEWAVPGHSVWTMSPEGGIGLLEIP